MNIYVLTKRVNGAEYRAVVIALAELRAIKMLKWEDDKNTKAIATRLIGRTPEIDEWIVCDESCV